MDSIPLQRWVHRREDGIMKGGLLRRRIKLNGEPLRWGPNEMGDFRADPVVARPLGQTDKRQREHQPSFSKPLNLHQEV